MKTQFSRTRRRTALLAPWSVPLIFVALALIVLFFILRAFLPGAVAQIARPFWGAGDRATDAGGSIAAFFGDKAVIAAERDRLSAENAALANENAALRARALDLERLLGSREAAPEGILAGVLARPPVSPYDTLVIDQGEDAGVRAGAPVFGAGGIPIGTVESVAGASARVILYSAPGQVTEGWVGVNRTPVTLAGASAGAFRTNLPRESTAAVGEEVYLPGPGALPVGTVVRVDTDPSSPRAEIHVRPVVHPFSITWVTVGR